MTLDEEIDYWKRASEEASTKEAALVAFGIHAGMRIAKEKINENAISVDPS